jgi:putative tryptophan/tyrosine transport system substrate-binding protein
VRLRVVFALGLLAWPLAAEAQMPTKVPRIGALFTGPPAGAAPYVEAFQQGLRELGYIEGQNIAIEYRWAQARADHFAELAADLVRARVDVLLTWGTPATAATRQATSTIPIVIVGVGDPVGSGFVASLARPGGNITGTTNLARELSQKLLGLLKEIVPGLSRIAVLRNPDNALSALQLRDLEAATRSFRVQAQILEVSEPGKFEGAFSTMVRERAEALIKGARPADLSVEQPTKFELAINLKTAKALGITIPESILVRGNR